MLPPGRLSAGYFLIASVPGGWVDVNLCGLHDGGVVEHILFTPVPGQLGGFVCVPDGFTAQFGAYIRTYYTVLLMLMGDDIGPVTRAETAYVVMVVLIGSCVNATIFANVASLTAQYTAMSATHQAKMDSIDRAMSQLHLDKSTSRRIRGYFNYRWVRHRDHAGERFIESLPHQLRTRTSCIVHEDMIRKCPLFAASERKFVAALSTILVAELYLPSQVHANCHACRMPTATHAARHACRAARVPHGTPHAARRMCHADMGVHARARTPVHPRCLAVHRHRWLRLAGHVLHPPRPRADHSQGGDGPGLPPTGTGATSRGVRHAAGGHGPSQPVTRAAAPRAQRHAALGVLRAAVPPSRPPTAADRLSPPTSSPIRLAVQLTTARASLTAGVPRLLRRARALHRTPAHNLRALHHAHRPVQAAQGQVR